MSNPVGKCPVCDSPRSTKSYTIRGYTYYRCEGCGMLFLYEPPGVSKSVSERYDAEYFKDDLKEGMTGYMDYVKQSQSLRMNFRNFLSYIRRHISLDGTRSMLDVGCAYGFLLDEAKKLGMSVHGVDLSESAVRWMGEKLGIEGTVGISSDAPEGPFDIITAIEVLEHINDPRSFLDDLYRRLTKGGVLLMHTGAIDSVTARLLGRWWWYLNPPDHCYIYSMEALRDLVDGRGFDVLEHRILPYHWVGLNNMMLKFARIVESKRLGRLASKLPALVIPVFQYCGQLIILRKR